MNHSIIPVILCVLLFFAGFGIIPAVAGAPGEVAYVYSTATLNFSALSEGGNNSVSSIPLPGNQSSENPSLIKEVISERSYLDYVPGSLVVVYETGNQITACDAFDSVALGANAVIGATVTQEFTDGVLPGCQVISLPDGMTVDEAVTYYEGQPDVAYAQPNFIYTIDTVPNDPDYSKQWGLQNTGQATPQFPSGGTIGADIHAEDAWDTTTGSEDIVIAVIDTGVDYLHADLAANMWNDGSGHYGYDFVNDDDDPMDDNGHGTHCAGIIAAVGNNGVGVSGVCWDAKIMALKVLNANGVGTTREQIQAINYAVTHGTDILSCSWGGRGDDPALKVAIEKSGLLVVCAAGNDGTDNDGTPHYPSSYPSPNILSVASTAPDDSLSYFSNYGATSVDVGAPGTNIYSTFLRKISDYTYMSGTSMATPMVSGVAGLLLAKNSSYTFADLKAAIMDSTDPLPTLSGKCVSGGRVNASAAMGPAPEPPIGPPSVSGITPSAGLDSGMTYITALTGTNFTGNMTVQLSRTGETAIPAEYVYIEDLTHARCAFNGAGAAAGAWDVSVTTVAGTATLPAAFTISADTSATDTVIIPVEPGWNMVSAPRQGATLDLTNTTPGTLYFYDPLQGRYMSCTVADIIPGRGYWVSAPSTTDISATGHNCPTYQYNVHTGWNLIGSIQTTVATGDITFVPASLSLAGDVYAYDPGTGQYTETTILTPGKAYWMAFSGDGVMIVA